MTRNVTTIARISRRGITPTMLAALQGSPAYGVTVHDGTWAVIDTQLAGGWVGTLVLAAGEVHWLLAEANGDLQTAAKLATEHGRAELARLDYRLAA